MIVSNSTPISNLLHIKHVHLLQKLFREVYIPDAVADDKDGREVAQMNQLPVTGTLGILLKAKSMGYIPEVKFLIEMLRSKKHFWIDERMYQKALSLAGE